MILEISVACITPILLYTLVVYIKHLFKCWKLPPGPFPLPVIGNLHLLTKDPHKALEKILKHYGDIFSISFGMERYLIICDISSMKEALLEKGKIFTSRPKSYVSDISSKGCQNLSLGDYRPKWILMHKIMVSSLSAIFKDKQVFETIVKKESEELTKRILNSNEDKVKIEKIFEIGAMNVLCGIIFGKQYDEKDEELQKVISFKQLTFEAIPDTFIITFLPWLRYFPSNGLKKLKKGLAIRDELISFQLKKHRETYNPNQMRDYTDYLLKYFKEYGASKNIDEQLNEDNMELMIQDIFIGGSDTIPITLLWFAVYLVHWPKYQDDIYNEIITVVGNDRYPCLSDRPKFHFYESAINETLRLSSILPLDVPHRTLENTSIKSFKIPKNTNVIVNLWQLHHDSRSWNDPHTFNPYRWLNEQKTFEKSKNPNYLPFLTGLRSCIGYDIAESVMFLFVTRLIRDFEFYLRPGATLPNLNGVLRAFLTPDTSNVLLKPRSNKLITTKNQIA